MNLWFTNYIVDANILLAITSAITLGMFVLKLKSRVSPSWKFFSRLSVILILLSLVFPLFTHLLPSQSFTMPSVQVWSSSSETGSTRISVQEAANSIGVAEGFEGSLPFSSIGWALFAVSLVLVGRYFKNLIFLYRFVNSQINFKNIGNVSLYYSEEIATPISCALFKKAYVVFPYSLLGDSAQLKISLKHELQHLRSPDTLFVHLFAFLKSAFFFNPFVYLFVNLISEIQEFACDEALVGRKKVSSYKYSLLLLEVSRNQNWNPRRAVGATGMVLGVNAKNLKRRIEMINSSRMTGSRLLASVITAGAVSLMSIAAYSSHVTMLDHRISKAKAEKLLQNAKKDSDFPLYVDEYVVEELNNFVATPKGREFSKNALKRMKSYEKMIKAKLKTANLPEELMAIPFAESGFYVKKQPKNTTQHGAGIWMFIKGTARRYKLQVDGGVDERLDSAKETDAAVAYLSFLNKKFKDWNLAMIGYNKGESGLEKGIRRTGSRNPTKLRKAGEVNSYISKIMASILIQKNPDILD